MEGKKRRRRKKVTSRSTEELVLKNNMQFLKSDNVECLSQIIIFQQTTVYILSHDS